MASRHKKESEGIALLSIYGDEDDEMEDIEEDEEKPQQQEEEEQERRLQQEVSIVEAVYEHTTTIVIEDNNGKLVASDSPGNGNTPTFMQQERQQQHQMLNNSFTPNKNVNYGGSASATTTPWDSLTSPQKQQPVPVPVDQRRQTGRLAIVDYGHDEVAMSPEAEEGEIMAIGGVMYGDELATVNGDFHERSVRVMTPSNQAQQYEQAESDAVNDAVTESKSAEPEEAVMVPAEESKDIDPLDKFLPAPTQAKCSVELQEKIIKFLALKKSTGRSFNAEVRNRKEYRNPDFLLHAVTYQDIDQIGSCFDKGVFDPHGYDKSDFYDEIEADMRREMERKEQERKKSQKVDFIPGGTQPGIVVPTPKVNMGIPGIPTMAGSGMNAIPSAVDSILRDGRQNKKSKWDKVDSGGQDSVSAVAVHAALLSAANAGTGSSQQKRRQAEDRRSSDRKLERRS